MTDAADPSRYGASALATPANAITVARMALAIPFLAFVANGGASYWAVLAWFVLTASDGIDGYLARRGIAVPARRSAKVKTVVQELAVAFALLPPVADSAEWVHVFALWAAVVLTIGTGISYVTDGARSFSSTGDRRRA